MSMPIAIPPPTKVEFTPTRAKLALPRVEKVAPLSDYEAAMMLRDQVKSKLEKLEKMIDRLGQDIVSHAIFHSSMCEKSQVTGEAISPSVENVITRAMLYEAELGQDIETKLYEVSKQLNALQKSASTMMCDAEMFARLEGSSWGLQIHKSELQKMMLKVDIYEFEEWLQKLKDYVPQLWEGSVNNF